VRRAVVLPAVLCLSVLGLTACGDDDAPENTGSVTVTGAFGDEPKVTYDGEVNRTKTETTVLTEGTGPEIEEGDKAFVDYYIGSGYTGKVGLNTWDKDAGTQFVTFTEDGMPLKAFRDAVIGQKVGSRIEVVATPKDAFNGQGSSANGIGNGDTVVFVIDIVSVPLEAPDGTAKKVPATVPKIVEKKGVITGFDFSKSAAPTDQVQAFTLIQGTGPKVKKGQTIVADYLGQVYGGKKPFDTSYGKDPASFALKNPGGVIKGWVQGLTGVKVGSRVVLVIPSRFGYGKKGSPPNIKGGDDLVFVVDVLGAA
jgi:peptidylprolyl isomerase